jgi:hypothetical protein
LAGYTFSQIQQRRRHSISSIGRYCSDFERVIRLHVQELSLADIRLGTGLSERLIREYLDLYAAVGPDNKQIQRLLTEPEAATQVPAEIKRGGLLR